jgi:protein required for attachment to host cells
MNKINGSKQEVLPMANTWIVVCNSTQAKIYQAKNNTELTEVDQLSHPDGRLKASELVSDRQGRVHESTTYGRSAYEPQTTVKEVEFTQFARTLCNFLDTSYNAGKFSKLYLIAGPHFLGLMRDAISIPIAKTIVGEIAKDITQFDSKKIREHLPEFM